MAHLISPPLLIAEVLPNPSGGTVGLRADLGTWELTSGFPGDFPELLSQIIVHSVK